MFFRILWAPEAYRDLRSTNGGITWSQRGVITGNVANIFTYKSGSGDTAVLMYYQTTTGLSDTTTAALSIARYKELTPGSLTGLGFFTNIIPAGPQKTQFGAAMYRGVIWVLYTYGAPSSRDLVYILSTDGGISYSSPSPPSPIANDPNVDKYYFDIQHSTFSNGGADIIYYWDSTGGPNNSTDKLMYTRTTIASPNSFSTPIQISQYPPQPSTRNYIPFLTEYYNSAGDVGAYWVGLTDSSRKLYFDRLLDTNTIGISKNDYGIPKMFSLYQNYPNPFNPSTNIKFDIPKSSFVQLTIYDVLGKEIAKLVNEELKPGSYQYEFDGSEHASGIYFYKIESGNFTQTKKMIMLK